MNSSELAALKAKVKGTEVVEITKEQLGELLNNSSLDKIVAGVMAGIMIGMLLGLLTVSFSCPR
jgi:hypothetical protein